MAFPELLDVIPAGPAQPAGGQLTTQIAGELSPAAISLSFVAPKPLRRIVRWPPRIAATCRTLANQSHQYRLPHTPLPWT